MVTSHRLLLRAQALSVRTYSSLQLASGSCTVSSGSTRLYTFTGIVYFLQGLLLVQVNGAAAIVYLTIGQVFSVRFSFFLLQGCAHLLASASCCAPSLQPLGGLGL